MPPSGEAFASKVANALVQCPEANATVQTSSTGSQYRIYCDMDAATVAYATAAPASSDGQPDYAQCFHACDADPSCLSFTAYGGCYLKNSSKDLLVAIGPSSGQRVTGQLSANAASTTRIPSCPAANGTVQMSTDGAQFEMHCDADSSFGAYKMISFPNATDFTQCLAACSANSTCLSFTSFNSNCYLKSQSGFLTTSRGVTLAQKLSAGSGSAASGTPPTSSGAASNPTAPSSKQSLSTGAIAGIVVGAIIALCLLVGVLFFWCRKRSSQTTKPRRSGRTSPVFEMANGQQTEGITSPISYGKFDDSPKSKSSSDHHSHDQGTVVSELSDHRHRHELDAENKF